MSAPFAERIHDRSVGPCRLLTLETPVDRVVSWRGSFLTYPNIRAGDDLTQQLMVAMLDKGTEQRDRFALSRVLEDTGAQLNVSSDGLYVDVSGRALAEDVPVVLELLAEMLRTPAFDAAEFEKAKAQALANLQQQMQDTGTQAHGLLTRRLYPPAHPNYNAPLEEQVAALQDLTVEDVQQYHAAHVGATDFALAVVGDLDRSHVEGAVRAAFGDWAPHDATPSHATAADPEPAGRAVYAMPDRDSIDVRMGHALPLRRDSDDYVALYVGNYILGGNFSARLMAHVRDEKGLTYGIGSGLQGITTRYSGHWRISVALSQEACAPGIAATRNEIRRFVDEGATAEELDAKKTTITGSYVVGLSTTRRLAHAILTNAERGFPMTYLDRFPDDVRALSLDDVNSAVRRYLRPDDLHITLAGTVPEAAQAA
ncbi:M16 family metallopeptidase [Salisaeta longa]|uniref:M16 family metallopeptidase n=1 Tax=Salisaeta longa TaxID=503170 RepID=UPI0003B69895|nr:pitrilysin family protein [Salisaeta longa]